MTFTQICFITDNRDPNEVQGKATALLKRLRQDKTAPDKVIGLGDRTLLPHHYEDRALPDMKNRLGGDIAVALRERPLESWQGPVVSGHGYHLVYIEQRVDDSTIPFDEVRDTVTDDWRREEELALKQKAYLALRKDYQVLVEGLPYQGDVE